MHRLVIILVLGMLIINAGYSYSQSSCETIHNKVSHSNRISFDTIDNPSLKVCGRVLDFYSKLPIPNANVRFYGIDAGGESVTDSAGVFCITRNKKSKVSASIMVSHQAYHCLKLKNVLQDARGNFVITLKKKITA